jgi:thiol-disulfide isomerase/thioredoxin
MKPIVKSAIGLGAFGVVFLLGLAIYQKIESNRRTANRVLVLPEFSFVTIDNKPFSTIDVPDSDSKIIIAHYNPECEHCQFMAKSLVQNSDRFNHVLIILITIADSASVSQFSNEYHLGRLQNILLLRDPKLQFEKTFGTSMIPSFFVYKDKKLIKKIIGETKIETLLN